MTHVSKKQLNKKMFKDIYDDFVRVLRKSTKAESEKFLLSEFFTDTEKVMFAKRISLIFMIDRGFSREEIRDILKVSSQTIFRYKKKNRQWKI